MQTINGGRTFFISCSAHTTSMLQCIHGVGCVPSEKSFTDECLEHTALNSRDRADRERKRDMKFAVRSKKMYEFNAKQRNEYMCLSLCVLRAPLWWLLLLVSLYRP